MRRTIPVLAATAGGLALLANFRTTPAATSARITAATPGSTEVTIPSPTTTTAGQATTTARPTTSTTQVTSRRTITGPDVPNRYGDVQVRITVTGHHLDDVQALQLPMDRERSAEISDYAGPRLRQEALRAQSANVDIVSGASYTSESYIQSLQGAIDAIG